MASSESDSSDLGPAQSPQKVSFSPCLSESDYSVSSPAPSQSADPLNPPPQSPEPPFSNEQHSPETPDESYYQSFHSNESGDSQVHSTGDGSVFEENSLLNGCGTEFDLRGAESGHEESHDHEEVVVGGRGVDGCGSVQGHKAEVQDPPPSSGASDDPEESPLIPMTLYLHRVKGLVLALMVDPPFLTDTASMEEVVRNKSHVANNGFLLCLSHFHTETL